MTCSIKPAVHQRSISVEPERILNQTAAVELGPLKDVLLAHNVRVDEKVAIPHTEVLLAGGAFEALEVVNLVPHTHGHLERPDPLLTRSTEAILTEKPEGIRQSQHVSSDVRSREAGEAGPHLSS